MPTYVILLEFTDQGIRNVKETVRRAQAFKEAAARAGVAVKAEYWTTCQPDIVIIAEAPDDETMAAVRLSVQTLGNVRARALPAFDAEAMTRVIARMQP